MSKAHEELKENRKETDDFFAAFHHQQTEEQQAKGLGELIDIELWENNLPLWEIYRLSQAYLTDMGGLPTQLISDLVERRKLDFEESLIYIPHIHIGYIRVTENKDG